MSDAILAGLTQVPFDTGKSKDSITHGVGSNAEYGKYHEFGCMPSSNAMITYTTPTGEHTDHTHIPDTLQHEWVTVGSYGRLASLDANNRDANLYKDKSPIVLETHHLGKFYDMSGAICGVVVDDPQTFTEYVATCGNTQKSRWACRGCEYVGECK